MSTYPTVVIRLWTEDAIVLFEAQQLLDENPSTCVYCRMEADSPQVDHTIPRSRGGNATLWAPEWWGLP